MAIEEKFKFEEAAEKVKHLKGSPSNDELLETYALYKQATVFCISESRNKSLIGWW